MNIDLNRDTSILVTGGTGSFGQAFVKHILSNLPDIKRLVVFSRDELKQYEMQKTFSTDDYPGLRYFIGDVRDKDRLNLALADIEVVIHAAALKQVPAAEYNPFEFIKTNIIGAQNLIESSLSQNVKKIIALSTDKAAAPINLYGATKLCSDKLFVAANNIVGLKETTFSVVRYGNVLGSRGSVIPMFLQKRFDQKLPITDPGMTRFNITLDSSIEIVLWALKNAFGGEIFVPKLPSYKIIDVASAVSPSAIHEIVGIRPGEKIHEEMITSSDSPNTFDLGDYYAILPPASDVVANYYIKRFNAKKVKEGFSYNSGSNTVFLTIEQIRSLIKTEIDPNFL